MIIYLPLIPVVLVLWYIFKKKVSNRVNNFQGFNWTKQNKKQKEENI